MMTRPQRWLIPTIAVWLLACAPTAQAWGKLGHQTVANVAWQLMDERTQRVIQNLLEASEYPRVQAICDEPCSPLAYVADWADDARHSKSYQWTTELHFVDIKDDQLPPECGSGGRNNESLLHDWRPDCGFVPKRDCARDFCASGAIVNYTQQLIMTAHNATPYDQKVALMFVAHFIGDVHQPLHVSRKTDRGGNDIAVHLKNWTTNLQGTTFRRRPQFRNYHEPRDRRPLRDDSDMLPRRRGGLNLHAVWDDSLIEAFIEHNNNNNNHTNNHTNHSGGLTFPFSDTTNWLRLSAPHRHKENRTVLEVAVLETIQAAQKEGAQALWLACPHGHVKACAEAWTQESWIYAQEYAYVMPNGSAILDGDTLQPDYYKRNIPIVLERLAAAAVRLAATLQTIFFSSPRQSSLAV